MRVTGDVRLGSELLALHITIG